MIHTEYHDYDLYEYIMTGFKKEENSRHGDVCLALLPKAVPTPPLPNKELCEVINPRGELIEYVWKTKQEGKTPMRNYNDAYASASVTAPKSDTSVQRDYLLERLDAAQYPKEKELQKVFNLFVDNKPKTYKELIDVIKNGKYTIDSKIAKRLEDDEDDLMVMSNNPFYGIIWEGPTSDWKGYHTSLEECYKQAAKARDTIMSGVYADGLKALQDFEAWLPVTIH